VSMMGDTSTDADFDHLVEVERDGLIRLTS
jgi:hypothetical protein